MANLLQDIRYGIRVLLKSPGFTIFAIVVLAVGIAANTAIFTIADAILMRPLPYHDANRLVMVWEDATTYGFPHDTPAPGNFADWKARNHVFEDMAATSSDESYNLTGEGEPEELLGRNVTANHSPSLRVKGRGSRFCAHRLENVRSKVSGQRVTNKEE